LGVRRDQGQFELPLIKLFGAVHRRGEVGDAANQMLRCLPPLGLDREILPPLFELICINLI
jgi:hypothetical protein